MKPTEFAAASIFLLSGFLFPLKAVSQVHGVQGFDRVTKLSWSQNELFHKDVYFDQPLPSFASLLVRVKPSFFMDDFWIHAVKQVRYSIDKSK